VEQNAHWSLVNITSYNITDVTYHYVGLRVVQASSGESRDRLAEVISTAVQKLVMDRALRLMLPAPRGTFSSVGEKVLNELKHFGLTDTDRKRVVLSQKGSELFNLLQANRFSEVRRSFVKFHLESYDNVRQVVEYLASGETVFRPIKDGLDLTRLRAVTKAFIPWQSDYRLPDEVTSQEAEDSITASILEHCFPNAKLTVPIFRSMCDRLTSMRLVNQPRASRDGFQAFAIYGTCSNAKQNEWQVQLPSWSSDLFLSEFALDKPGARNALSGALEEAFGELSPEGGFFDLPDVRDKVCLHLRIPEAAFDDALLQMLDSSDPGLSLGLRYERITARRKPLIRQPGNQLFNLIRPTE
jgi:hypothetical protein